MKSVTICVRGLVDRVPSIISTSEILRELGYRVACLCDAAGATTRAALRASDTHIIELNPRWRTRSSLITKALDYLRFRRESWAALKANGLQDSPLWVVRIDTARALGRRLAKTRFIFDVKELHDTYPSYQKHLKFYCRNATRVVAREATRAAIMRVWYGLEETPHRPAKQTAHSVKDARASHFRSVRAARSRAAFERPENIALSRMARTSAGPIYLCQGGFEARRLPVCAYGIRSDGDDEDAPFAVPDLPSHSVCCPPLASRGHQQRAYRDRGIWLRHHQRYMLCSKQDMGICRVRHSDGLSEHTGTDQHGWKRTRGDSA